MTPALSVFGPDKRFVSFGPNPHEPGAGRNNWIHVGSQQAGPKVAAILSFVESCRRLKIPIREYLAGVLPGLAGTSVQRLAELTPTAWEALNP